MTSTCVQHSLQDMQPLIRESQNSPPGHFWAISPAGHPTDETNEKEKKITSCWWNTSTVIKKNHKMLVMLSYWFPFLQEVNETKTVSQFRLCSFWDLHIKVNYTITLCKGLIKIWRMLSFVASHILGCFVCCGKTSYKLLHCGINKGFLHLFGILGSLKLKRLDHLI